MESIEKDETVQKLRANVKLLKDKVKQKTENSDLINIYEQQLNEKDELIEVKNLINNFLIVFIYNFVKKKNKKELNGKLGRLNDTLVDKVETKDEEIYVSYFKNPLFNPSKIKNYYDKFCKIKKDIQTKFGR